MSGRPDQGGRASATLGRPSLLVGSGHLAALWALAFAEPLFDLLGRNADFFVARGNSAGDILAFSFAFTFVPPLVMLAVEAVADLLDRRLRWGIHLLLVGLLVAAIALQVFKKVADGPGGVLIALALLTGILATWGYARTRFLRGIADVLIPAPAVVLAFFLLFSDASELVLPQNEAEATAIEIRSRVPVVEIIFDEFPVGTLMDRNGGIDASRFPAFAELAAHSTWYRGATTVAGFTPRAVPAILTGRVPGDNELPTSSDQPRSIFTLLGGTYRMNVMEEATALCPKSLCGDEGRPSSTSGLGSLFSDLRIVSEHLLLPNGIRNHLPAVDETFGDFASETATQQPATQQPATQLPRRRFAPGEADALARALRRRVTDDESVRLAHFLSGISAGGPVLDLIHVLKPHAPWTHFPDGRKYTNLSAEFDDVLAEDSTWLGPESLTDLALQRIILETGFTDHLLGQLIARMKQTGLWEQALLVVTADHGNAVIPHVPRRNPTRANFGQIAPVPLFVKASGQQHGRIVRHHVCTTDILPMTARMLGIAYPWPRSPCPPRKVTVADSSQGSTSLGFERVERLRDSYVARIDRLFGSGTGWGPVLRFRPHPELVSQAVRTLAVTTEAGPTASIDDAARLRDADPQAPVVLASLLRGAIVGGEPGEALVAAVNGRIAAVGTSFSAAGSVRYSLLIPPRYLRKGANRVEVYRVLGNGNSLRLQSLGP
ncbi:MAG TPA: sulfatase-like hydrolase/transferase [Solirubrobacterales bacterium]